MEPEYKSVDWYILYIDNLIKDNPPRGKYRFSRQQINMLEVLKDHLTRKKNNEPTFGYILNPLNEYELGRVIDFIASFK